MVAFAGARESESYDGAPSSPFGMADAVALDGGESRPGSPSFLASRVCAEKQGGATFTGYVADAEIGLMYARARMYAPGMGRFVGRDPLRQVDGIPVAGDGYLDGVSLYNAVFVPDGIDPLGTEKINLPLLSENIPGQAPNRIPGNTAKLSWEADCEGGGATIVSVEASPISLPSGKGSRPGLVSSDIRNSVVTYDWALKDEGFSVEIERAWVSCVDKNGKPGALARYAAKTRHWAEMTYGNTMWSREVRDRKAGGWKPEVGKLFNQKAFRIKAGTYWGPIKDCECQCGKSTSGWELVAGPVESLAAAG